MGSARRRLGTIGAHLTALVAIQAVLVVGLIGYAASQDFRKVRVDAREGMSTLATSASRFLADEIQATRDSFATAPDLFETVPVAEICKAQQQTDSTPSDLRSLQGEAYILRDDGSQACDYRKNQPNVAAERWFQDTLHSPELIERGPLIDPVTNENSMIYALSIPTRQTVIAITVKLASIPSTLGNQLGSPSAPAAYVVTTKDRQTELGSTGGKTGRNLAGSGFTRPTSSARYLFDDLAGTARFWGEATVADLGWHVYAGVSTADAFATARRELANRMVLAIAFLVVVLAAAFVIQRRFVRPIRSLAETTQRAMDGQLTDKVVPRGPVELEELGESFNAMLDVRNRAEAALKKAFRSERRAADELREVDAMRQAFLMAISHELRTPLTSVVGFATFLQESRADLTNDELDQSIEAIASQSKRLERLLLDLLDVERLTRGMVQPHLRETDVSDLLTRAVERTSLNGRLSTRIPKGLKAVVDPALVERIVENLINNAVKHTPPGTKIWVRANGRRGDLVLTVEDAGPGVPDKLKTAIFEPFMQGKVRSHAPGTGVGLSLVAQFAKLHGGRAWVEDRRGGGASFRVVLPNRPSAAKPKDGSSRATKAPAAA